MFRSRFTGSPGLPTKAHPSAGYPRGSRILDTDGKRGNVNEDVITGSFSTSEDTGLDGGVASNSFVGFATPERFLTTEVLLKEPLDLEGTGRTANGCDLINTVLRDMSILEKLFDGLHRLSEEIQVEKSNSPLGISEVLLSFLDDWISRRVDFWFERVCFAFLTSCPNLPMARRLVDTSVSVFFLYYLTK